MRAMRADGNQKDIVKEFRDLGATVRHIKSEQAGTPDLAVGYRHVNHLVECKVPKSGRISDKQLAFAINWSGEPPHYVRSPADAVLLVAAWGRNGTP